MDQEKIGRFIASCRKEAGLTQAGLAEKLGITDRAVSKWENGRSMPDVSIMLTLCSLLGINVNELLSGEHLEMENYKEKAEENLLQLQKAEEEGNRKMLSMDLYKDRISRELFLNAGDDPFSHIESFFFTPAPFIRAVICRRRKDLAQKIAMGKMHLYAIESGLLSAYCSRDEVGDHFLKFRIRHLVDVELPA